MEELLRLLFIGIIVTWGLGVLALVTAIRFYLQAKVWREEIETSFNRLILAITYKEEERE